MTIKEVIDYLRISIRQGTDDSKFTDEYLYITLINVRNDLLRKSLDEKKYINDSIWTTFFMPLKAVDISSIGLDSSCLCLGEKVYRSVYKLPKMLNTGKYLFLTVNKLNGVRIDRKNYVNREYSKYKLTKPTVFYDLVGEYLYVFETQLIKGVKLKAVIEDFTDLINLPKFNDECDIVCTDGVEEVCYDIYKTEFTIESSLFNTMIRMCMEILSISLQIPNDSTENNADDI